MSTLRWYAWKVWNRTRYYWPQAQSRRRAQRGLDAAYAKHGIEWEGRPRKPWWIP